MGSSVGSRSADGTGDRTADWIGEEGTKCWYARGSVVVLSSLLSLLMLVLLCGHLFRGGEVFAGMSVPDPREMLEFQRGAAAARRDIAAGNLLPMDPAAPLEEGPRSEHVRGMVPAGIHVPSKAYGDGYFRVLHNHARDRTAKESQVEPEGRAAR